MRGIPGKLENFVREPGPLPPAIFLLDMLHFQQGLSDRFPCGFHDPNYGATLVDRRWRVIVPNRALSVDCNETHTTLRRSRSPMEREINRPLSQNWAARESAIRLRAAVEGAVQSVNKTGSQTTKTRTGLPAN